MKISRSTGYAILALGYMAKHQDKPIILSQNISKAYNIPLEYLLKIMQQMVRVNILKSKRGPRGGFSLARPLKKVSMLEVIEAVEGPMISQLDLEDIAPKEKFGVRAEQVYAKALAQAKAVFEKNKLADILR
jgi:Rrf2 family protein